MIKVISALALPSMSQFDHLFDAYRTPQYNVFGYLSNSKGDIYNIVGILTRLQLLKTLVAHGNVPFYGSDLFGSSCALGGWMNGLSVWGIIKETGNVREVMVQIDDDLYRKCPIKEWELAFDVALLQTLRDEFKAVLMAQF